MKPSREYGFEPWTQGSVQGSFSLAPNTPMSGHFMRWVGARGAGGLCHWRVPGPLSRLWPRVSWHHPPMVSTSCVRPQWSQHPTLAPSKCRQQYLNLSSMLPKIPTEILGFQIRNILKNCISWGLENIFLSDFSYLKAQDWILYEWITDFCPLFVVIGVYNYSWSWGKCTWELQ